MNAPRFIEQLHEAYRFRGKGIVLFTGNVNDLFWSPNSGRYLSLEQVLQNELQETMTILRYDIGTGVEFVGNGAEEYVEATYSYANVLSEKKTKTPIADLVVDVRHSPLPNLVLLKDLMHAFRRARIMEETREKKDRRGHGEKPLCLVVQHTGMLFPEGDGSRLSDADRERLAFFLSWVNDPAFASSSELIILVSSVRAEVNTKVTALPHAAHIEIQLPNSDERTHFTERFLENNTVSFEKSKELFIESAAGLTITTMHELLRFSASNKGEITRGQVVDEVNRLLQAKLGDIIRIKYPTHRSTDIVGYARTKELLQYTFERCEDPETAVSAVLVAGSNGVGKTFHLEAFAAESGRVVIELGNIRGSYFSETDRFFEMFRWYVSTLGRILILVDEAHTAFGSVHGNDTHETEKRLAGNVIKMMGDPSLLGKVVWGLMTSRPDELDPDVKSRAPIQIPIFDLEDAERKSYIREIFLKKKMELTDEELETVFAKTLYYSNRDFRNFVAEVLAERKRQQKEIPIVDVLGRWQASRSIMSKRHFQELIAALHCSYIELLPKRLTEMKEGEIERQVEILKHSIL
ncbi:MAG: ATP-binding protein [bacterium]|nr:ATP-binding protein [bacterium]